MDLEREDYQEPHCPFCTDQWQEEAPVHAIPIGRVLEKLDEYYSRDDFPGALRLIDYWMAEAEDGNDLRGQFSLRNELMGIYRKTGKKEQATDNAEKALALIKKIGLERSVTEGTALVNAATVYKAFREPEKSIALFERAKNIYESYLKEDERLGGLYNNMALTLADLGRLDDSQAMFLKAIESLESIPGTQAQQAISWLNIADVLAEKHGLAAAEDQIAEACQKAAELLDSEEIVKDGEYAYACEKCAPVFGYYGFFMAEEHFSEIARSIHERP